MSKKQYEGDKRSRKNEEAPIEMIMAMLKLLKSRKKGEYIFREGIAEELLKMNPAWAKHIFNLKVPFGFMCKPEILEKIEDKMPMKTKLEMYKSSQVDVSELRYANLGRITGMKRRLINKGHAITSNSHQGFAMLDKVSPESVAKKIYDVLRVNAGQLKIWHMHIKKFNDGCKDKGLVRRLKLYSCVAMDSDRLPKLRDDVGEIAKKDL